MNCRKCGKEKKPNDIFMPCEECVMAELNRLSEQQKRKFQQAEENKLKHPPKRLV